MSALIKICGLRTAQDLACVIEAGAQFAGFVHCLASPRHLELPEIAPLVAHARGRIHTVVLLVNPTMELVRTVVNSVQPDYIQLHGQETAHDIAAMKTAFPSLKIIKAIGIATQDDVAQLADFAQADMLLLDAKPPKDAQQTGGHGVAFDWQLIAGIQLNTPWLLAGGLAPENVSDALQRTRAPGVDVSSGVEQGLGVKSHAKIRAFIQAVQNS